MSSKKVFVTLTYASPGAVPPIFLAGSFSEPAWHPQEMEFRADENGELQFHKEVQVEEGAQFQYKFRIGTGEWWALNEQAPTVTDESGNRNNFLSVPITKDIVDKSLPSASDPAPPVSDMPTNEESIDKALHSKPASEPTETELPIGGEVINKSLPSEPAPVASLSKMSTPEEVADRSSTSESNPATPISDMPAPEVVVEKVDEQPRHGDDFGPEATTGQKDAHGMRAQDAQPDHVVIRSETNTPVYAMTAAEVADSAAMLDREPSPVPVSDEEAGRTGERRMSSTPIPQVALTAAEVADIAMIIYQDDEEDMRINASHSSYPFDTPSGPTTPWHERAPLFAHECLGPNDGMEVESPMAYDAPQSPIEPKPEEVIDMNDPLLEPFPEDRMSILTHIRSTESRMSEDETNFSGVLPSPVNRPKSRLPSLDTPCSARLDAQLSPSLDIIAEENHESDSYFGGLLAPIENMHDQVEMPKKGELNVIREAEEPAEEPKTVLENLKKIEDSTENSIKTMHKDAGVEPIESEVRKPVEGLGTLEEQNLIDGTEDQVKSTETENIINETVEPTKSDENESMEGPSEVEEQNVTDGGNEHTEPLDVTNKSMKLGPVNKAEDPEREPTETGVPEKPELYEVRKDPHVGLKDVSTAKKVQDLELLEEPKKGLTENIEQQEDSKEVKKSEVAQKSDEQHQADKAQPNEEPEQKVDSVEPAEAVEPQDVVEMDPPLPLQSQESQHAEDPREMEESTQIVEAQPAEDSRLGSVNGTSMRGVTLNDPPAATTIEVQDLGQSSDSQGVTLEHAILESETYKSAVALENPPPDTETDLEEELPTSQIKAADEAPPIHVKPATSDSNDLEEIDETQTNGVDNAKSTAAGDPSPNGHDTSKLKLRSTTPNLEPPLTPSSIRSPMKGEGSRNFFQAIWRTVFVGWIGGIIASLCGGERGPLIAVSAFVILAPLLAMYFYKPRQAL